MLPFSTFRWHRHSQLLHVEMDDLLVDRGDRAVFFAFFQDGPLQLQLQLALQRRRLPLSSSRTRSLTRNRYRGTTTTPFKGGFRYGRTLGKGCCSAPTSLSPRVPQPPDRVHSREVQGQCSGVQIQILQFRRVVQAIFDARNDNGSSPPPPIPFRGVTERVVVPSRW